MDGDPARQTSHWTLGGRPLPFVPLLEGCRPVGHPPAYRELYARSLAQHGDRAAEAAIPVERISGDLVVIGGEDDQVWPGAEFARMIAARRNTYALPTTVVTHSRAGHRVAFPGEEHAVGGRPMTRGGSAQADAALGAMAWPAVLRVLGLPGRLPSA